MTDFLLELLSEEIPARMQGKAKDDLARLFSEQLAKAGLKAESVETFATPRRLALIAKGLPLETEAVSEETKGPKVGAPPQALEGFLRKTGLTQDQLEERGGIYFAVVNKPGRKTADVLGEAIPAIIRAFPWPKSMRWGKASISTESLRWVRPLQGIVALLGDDVVPTEIDGIASGRETVGHRFHSSGPVSVADAGAYIEALRAAHVIVHFSERCAIIRDGAKKLAADKGLVWIEDEALVAENAGLTEWPVPLIGDFDPAFLEVPREVIQLTLATNQKYFVCADSKGNLAPAFICTANIVANDGGEAIVAGNRKVLAARLSDARFFWEQDQKTPLAEQAKKLERITFHEKLGTVADKVDRVAQLARWLVEEGIVTPSPTSPNPQADKAPYPLPLAGEERDLASESAPSRSGEGVAELADMAEQAARLAKADLVTEMVGEFPELQGVMGGYYAAKEGLPLEVSNAIRDHYKPVGQGDEVPTAPVTVAVSLADKLDTLVGFFLIDEKPTGSKDPFALRRAALGIIRQIFENELRFELAAAIMAATLVLLRQSEARLGGADVRYAFEAMSASGALSTSADEYRKSVSPAFDAVRIASSQGFGKLAGASKEAATKAAATDVAEILVFLIERLIVLQRNLGMRADRVEAVVTQADDSDFIRVMARVKALQTFIGTEDGKNLLAGYKRAANLLSKSDSVPAEAGTQGSTAQGDTGHLPAQVHGTLTSEEENLLTALDAAEPKASAAIEAEDFEGAMAALATLRAPVDAFFDGVMVNDPDPQIRSFRLGLLARVRDAVNRVADFSKIEG